MVAHSRTPLRFDQLRALNQPQPLKVDCDRLGRPVGLLWHGRRRRIQAIKDHWRIDDEWWRQEIRRHYYLVELDGGSLEVLFCDMITGRWYRQKESVQLYAAYQEAETNEVDAARLMGAGDGDPHGR